MPTVSDPYKGREHSKIKHHFLARYLQEASFKVLQGPFAVSTFTYIDGFAGPWSVADQDDCSDSSFDYAVRILLGTREALLKAGRRAPNIRFLLCERDRHRLGQLRDYAAKKKDVDIRIFEGAFEDNLENMYTNCADGFTFSFIDPTGWNLRSADIADFLAKVRGDFLINFMEHPISRHNTYDPVYQSFARLLDDQDWGLKIDRSEGAPAPEIQILQLLKSRLRSRGAAAYLPDFPILMPRKDRIQMRLVLGTTNVQGVEVFRGAQKKMEMLQIETRRDIARSPDDHQLSLLSDDEMTALELGAGGVGGRQAKADAAEKCRAFFQDVYHAVRFDKLAGSIMEDIPLRMTDMKDVVVKLRAEGVLRFELEGRTTKPQESTLIWRVRS